MRRSELPSGTRTGRLLLGPFPRDSGAVKKMQPCGALGHSRSMVEWFNKDDQEGLRHYWAVYDAHFDAINAATIPVLLDHPQFGPIIKGMPQAQLDEQNRVSREN